MHLDGSGNLYTASGADYIKYDSNLNELWRKSTLDGNDAEILTPDGSGSAYVATGSHTYEVDASDGTVIQSVSTTRDRAPDDLHVTADGTIVDVGYNTWHFYDSSLNVVADSINDNLLNGETAEGVGTFSDGTFAIQTRSSNLYYFDSVNDTNPTQVDMSAYGASNGLGHTPVDDSDTLYIGGDGTGVDTFDSAGNYIEEVAAFSGRTLDIDIGVNGNVYVGDINTDETVAYDEVGVELWRHSGRMWLASSPSPIHYPDAWVSTVTKSASSTKVASTSTQKTPAGARVSSASPTKVPGAGSMLSPAGTSVSVVSSTKQGATASPTTPNSIGTAPATASYTSSAASPATPSPNGIRTSSATMYGSVSSTKTASGAKGRTAVGTRVSGQSSQSSPNALLTTNPSPETYSKLFDITNSGLRDVTLSDGSASAVASTKTISVNSHTQDETGAIYATGGGTLTKYTNDGSLAWETTEANTNYSSPVVTDTGYIYYIRRPSSADDEIVKADSGTGNVVWSVPAANPDSSYYTLEVDAGNAIYYSNEGNAITAYDTADGTEKWLSDITTDDFTVAQDGTVYSFKTGTSPYELYSTDPATGTSTATGLTINGSVGELQADDSGYIYFTRSYNSTWYLAKYATGGTQQWEVTMSGSPQGQVALNVDGSITYKTDVSGTNHHIRLDSTGTQAWDVSRSYNFALIHPPKVASNPSAWTSTTSARTSSSKVTSSSTPTTPSSNGIASPGVAQIASSTTMSGAGVVSTASPGATRVASTATPVTPGSNGQIGASATTISGTSAPNSPNSTGVASSTASPYPSTTTMRVVQRGQFVDVFATPVSASSTMDTTSVTSSTAVSSVKYASDAIASTPNSVGTAPSTASAVSAQASLSTPAPDGGVSATASYSDSTTALLTPLTEKGVVARSTPHTASSTTSTPSIHATTGVHASAVPATASLTTPPVTTQSPVYAQKYGATVGGKAPQLGIALDVQKYDATTTPAVTLMYAPRIRQLGDGQTTSSFTGRGASFTRADIDTDRNDADIE